MSSSDFNPRQPSGRFRHRGTLWLSLLTTLLLAACSTPMAPKHDARFLSYASASNRPATRPVRSMSSFSDSLACMDEMMREAGVPTTLISSTFIRDFSGRIPVATQAMVMTALSQMSRRSNAFRYVDFEVDIARQDTVQNMTIILLNNNQVELQRPALYVTGAISFVDQNVLRERHGVGVSGRRVEAGYNSNRGATIVGLEMQLGDFRTRTLIPGLDSANEVIIDDTGQGLDLAGRIGSYGVQFNIGRDLTQGTGAAMRTLVDLAMIELAGKWTHLPYWRCLTLDNTHPEFQRQLREWYDADGAHTRLRLVRNYLQSRGYLGVADDSMTADSLILREAVGQFQTDIGAVPTGRIDFDVYERTLRDFVAVGPDGKLARIGWAELGRAEVARVPLTLDMQIENTVKDRTAFAPGTNIFASVALSRAAHLMCYVHDSNGNIVKLFPNMVQPESLVSSNLTIRLPDWMVPYPAFILSAGQRGHESLMCAASDEDPATRLPAELNVDALTVIHEVDSLDTLREQLQRAVAPAELAVQTLDWRILDRGMAPAAGDTDLE